MGGLCEGGLAKPQAAWRGILARYPIFTNHPLNIFPMLLGLAETIFFQLNLEKFTQPLRFVLIVHLMDVLICGAAFHIGQESPTAVKKFCIFVSRRAFWVLDRLTRTESVRDDTGKD